MISPVIVKDSLAQIIPADTAIGRQRQPGRRMPRQPRPPGAKPANPGSRASLTIMGKYSLAVIAPAETAIGRPTATARRLVDASVSANTRCAYAGALGRLDAWLAGRQIDDAALAAHL